MSKNLLKLEWIKFSKRVLTDFSLLGHEGVEENADFWITALDPQNRDVSNELDHIGVERRYISVLLFNPSLMEKIIDISEAIVQDFPTWSIWIIDKSNGDNMKTISGKKWDDQFVWDGYEDLKPSK